MRSPDIYPTANDLCEAAADFWLAAYAAAVIEHDSFHVALSGGTTPKKLYERLATPAYQEKINWKKVHIYFGDERLVPLEHTDSNYNMAKKAMLSQINCPDSHIHHAPVELFTGLSPSEQSSNREQNKAAEAVARKYDELLQKSLPSAPDKQPTKKAISPQFDLVLLGLGPDGHTASLFPGTEAVNVTDRLCSAVFVERLKSWRISITFPVINNAKKILLLSEGSSKVDIIKELTNKDTPTLKYPVQHVRQTNGFFWYVDQAAVNIS